jgi:hypothetical protein
MNIFDGDVEPFDRDFDPDLEVLLQVQRDIANRDPSDWPDGMVPAALVDELVNVLSVIFVGVYSKLQKRYGLAKDPDARREDLTKFLWEVCDYHLECEDSFLVPSNYNIEPHARDFERLVEKLAAYL